MTAFESKIHLQSRSGVASMQEQQGNSRRFGMAAVFLPVLSQGELRQKSDIVSMIRFRVV